VTMPQPPDQIIRTLADIRSDLRGAIALGPRHPGRFRALLVEAKAACGSPDEWANILRELSISDELLANYLRGPE
jgi:hypothetical protein